MKSLFLLVLFVVFSFTSAEIIKHVDTLDAGTGLNITTGTKYSHQDPYFIADTTPDIDLFFYKYGSIPSTNIFFPIYGIGSPRPFFIPWFSAAPGGYVTTQSMVCFSLMFADSLNMTDTTWFTRITVTDTTLGVPYLPFQKWNASFTGEGSSGEVDSIGFVVQTQSKRYVVVRADVIKISVPLQQGAPMPTATGFKRIIVTTWLQTNGTTDFRGIAPSTGVRSQHTTATALPRSHTGISNAYDLRGRLLQKGVTKGNSRLTRPAHGMSILRDFHGEISIRVE